MGKAVAGFEQNQTYGLGANSMTSDEKSGLIFGAAVQLDPSLTPA